MIRLHHCFTHFQKLGGVEGFLKQHRLRDPEFELDSETLAFFEPETALPEKVSGLGLTGTSSIWTARNRMRTWRKAQDVSVICYHNFWGSCFLHDLDGASRRIGLAHTHWPEERSTIRAQEGILDGILCVSDSLREVCLRELPSLDERRVRTLPSPIEVPRSVEKRRVVDCEKPLQIGIVGRVSREQKRIDLLPGLLEALKSCRGEFEFRILGGGPQSAWLKSCLGNDGRVALLGRLSGQAYWDALTGLDVILFLSDYEGLPLGLLEAMACGAIPVYPSIGSGGEAYVESVGPQLLYRQGDMEALALILESLSGLPQEERVQLMGRAFRATEKHRGDRYWREFSGFLKDIEEWPRISEVGGGRRTGVGDFLPFGLLARWAKWGVIRR